MCCVLKSSTYIANNFVLCRSSCRQAATVRLQMKSPLRSLRRYWRKGDLRRPSDRMGRMSVRAGADIHQCGVQRPLRVPSLTNTSEKKPFQNQNPPKFSDYPPRPEPKFQRKLFPLVDNQYGTHIIPVTKLHRFECDGTNRKQYPQNALPHHPQNHQVQFDSKYQFSQNQATCEDVMS